MLDMNAYFPREKKEMVKETELTANSLKLCGHTATPQIKMHVEASYSRGEM